MYTLAKHFHLHADFYAYTTAERGFVILLTEYKLMCYRYQKYICAYLFERMKMCLSICKDEDALIASK
jgi:hypothetical protein